LAAAVPAAVVATDRARVTTEAARAEGRNSKKIS
jgi:hypothetical protein